MNLDIYQLFDVYTKEIRSILEMAVPVWHSGLTNKQTADIESIQKVAMQIILQQNYISYAFACKTFAFRYGNAGSKNCELSDRDFRDIQLRTDLDPDRDWDVFERTRYSGECRDKSGAWGNGDSIIIDRLSRRTY